ncbi:hypothetical protein PHYPSEUDO_014675 [Phytophthora pseudosyringae]|uniref:HTH CENPB-type domain-containing protein n=1 Tax=Phytophthora pseudosyringae TaxID=221518 RepID=A0A8T1W160_9STRA|nr:hypothetical protein PHYPSEUDO_014675 [Phytophthora pseudosyringae]
MSTPAAPEELEKPKRARTSFTNAQRLQICNHKEQYPTITQGQLATWAQEVLELPRKPSQAMISKLLKRKPDLETMTTEELTCKSRRTVRFPNLDTALARWVAYCEETGVPVTGESIRVKAASCWYKTGLLYAEKSDCVREYRGEEDAISEELAVMLSWLHAADPLTVEELLNLPEESVIMDEPTDEDFCAPVASVKVSFQQLNPKPADTDSGLSVDELKERLKWIAKLLIYADEKGVQAESVSGMRVLQRDFRDQLNKKQSGTS